VREVVAAIAGAAPPPAEVSEKEATADLGACPLCGTPVREGKSVFACDTGRACTFVVWKIMSTRKISARMVRQLLKDGRSELVKGFKSKAGKPFDAALEWREGKVQFAFPPREEQDRGPRPGEPPRAPKTDAAPKSDAPPKPKKATAKQTSPDLSPVGLVCPACGNGRTLRGRSAWGCDRWREGCRFVLPFEHGGALLSDAEAHARIVSGR
jgi:DNA topoisomerase-3